MTPTNIPSPHFITKPWRCNSNLSSAGGVLLPLGRMWQRTTVADEGQCRAMKVCQEKMVTVGGCEEQRWDDGCCLLERTTAKE